MRLQFFSYDRENFSLRRYPRSDNDETSDFTCSLTSSLSIFSNETDALR